MLPLSERYLEKVTAFVTRQGPAGLDLLLFRHPDSGIQLPAGTVEEGEPPEQAALREVREETGLANVRLTAYIGSRRELPPGSTHVILHGTRVYARPDAASFDWVSFHRGIAVRLERQQRDFCQVSYIEHDQEPDPAYVSYQITGWVPESALASANLRHFYHLALVGDAPDAWEQFADRHRFRLFWSPFSRLEPLIYPQNEWLTYATGDLAYQFS